jgi:hypothetical protein
LGRWGEPGIPPRIASLGPVTCTDVRSLKWDDKPWPMMGSPSGKLL